MVPDIAATQQAAHAIAGGGKAMAAQHGQGVPQVVLVAVIKGQSNDTAGFFAGQVRLQIAHGQATKAQQLQHAHLPGEGTGVHHQAAHAAAARRRGIDLVVHQNRDLHTCIGFRLA